MAEAGTSAVASAEPLAGVVVGPQTEPLAKAILDLQAKQAELQPEKKRIAKDLRNALRKKRRLKSNARQLTDEDLVAVLMMRRDARDAATANVRPVAAVISSTGTAAEASSPAVPPQ